MGSKGYYVGTASTLGQGRVSSQEDLRNLERYGCDRNVQTMSPAEVSIITHLRTNLLVHVKNSAERKVLFLLL